MDGLLKIDPVIRRVDAVYEALREAILAGRLPPGQQLSVPELSRQMGVSRSPVREAVLQLVASGLALEQPRKGVVVAKVDAVDLLGDSRDLGILSILAARLCAERIDAGGIKKLQEVLKEQEEAVEKDDPKGYFETNAKFHAYIGQFSCNSRLSEIMGSLEGQMRIGLQRLSLDVTQRRRAYKEHLKVLAAIKKGDADAAEASMRHHIGATKERLGEVGYRASREPN